MKVARDDIIKFNELYQKYGTYASVARETGFSATTVKKYINKDFGSPAVEKKIFKKEDIPTEVSFEKFKNLEYWSELILYSPEEELAVVELRKELDF